MAKTIKKKRIFLSPPHMEGNEIDYGKEAFKSRYIAPAGPQLDAFEKDFSRYTGIKYCVAVSSGTAAMHLALRLLKVTDGDEVFASTLTFIGSVSPIIYQRATPVFIDSERTSWNMSPRLLEEALELSKKRGKLPKAVVPTDLYGQCCNYDEIKFLCQKYGVALISDSAEAMGSHYHTSKLSKLNLKFTDSAYPETDVSNSIKPPLNNLCHAGKLADVSIFSFNGNKIITTSGGGILASDNYDIVERARYISQQARAPFAHYEHFEIGYNYRLSNVLAAIGIGQLKILDKRVDRRREIYKYYEEALSNLPGIEMMPEPNWSISNRWLTVILVQPDAFGSDRETIRLALEKENIESRPVWKPMHLQPIFMDNQKLLINKKDRQQGIRVVGGEVAEDLFDRGLCLPSGTMMTNADLDRVIDVIVKASKT